MPSLVGSEMCIRDRDYKNKPKQHIKKKGWFKGGWFTGVKDYFKKKDLETIDVSGGKVRKNIKDNGQLMGIDAQMENSQSFFTNQSDEDILEMRKKRNEKLQAKKVQKEKETNVSETEGNILENKLI